MHVHLCEGLGVWKQTCFRVHLIVRTHAFVWQCATNNTLQQFSRSLPHTYKHIQWNKDRENVIQRALILSFWDQSGQWDSGSQSEVCEAKPMICEFYFVSMMEITTNNYLKLFIFIIRFIEWLTCLTRHQTRHHSSRILSDCYRQKMFDFALVKKRKSPNKVFVFFCRKVPLKIARLLNSYQ